MMRFRRLVTRYERLARKFLAFAKLACIAILLLHPAFRRTHRLGRQLSIQQVSDAFYEGSKER
jgi:hypothetical protein